MINIDGFMMITQEFGEAVADYMFSKGAYDEGDMLVLNFADVAAFARALGVDDCGEYDENDLDVMVEAAPELWFRYIEGDECEALFVVRRGFHTDSDGRLWLD